MKHLTIAEKYQRRVARLTSKVRELEAQLSVERSLRRALALMAFAENQSPANLRNLRRAATNYQKLKLTTDTLNQ